MLRHFLGPDPMVEPRTFRRGRVRRRPARGRLRQRAAHDGRRRWRPRRLQAAPLPRGRLPSATRARAGRRRRRRRLAAELRRSRAVLRRGGTAGRRGRRRVATRSPPGVPARSRCRPAPDMFGAVLSMDAADRSRPAPVPGADRRQLRAVRRTTGVHQLRLLRRASVVPIEAKGDPVALLRRALRTGRCEIRPESYVVEVVARRDRAARPPACATSTPTARRHEVRRRYVVLAAGAFETPRLLLRQGLAQLVGPRRAQPHVPLPDVHRSGPSRSACTAMRGRS